MNYALLFVIILLCMGGYYEYTNLTKEITQDKQTQSDQTDKITALQGQTDTLTKANADLTSQLNTTKQQLATAQAALNADIRRKREAMFGKGIWKLVRVAPFWQTISKAVFKNKDAKRDPK